MTILDRYFSGRLLATFFKAIVSLVLLFILIDVLTQRRNDIIQYDVPFTIVVAYYVAAIPQILYKYQVAALSMLVSALLVFGNAAQNNEITAALAGGISLRRLVRTPVLIAAGLAVALFFLQDTLGTAAARQAERLEARYLSRSAQSRRPGVSWPHLANNWTCHIMKFNRVALTGEHVLMHSFRPDAVEQIQARRIYWDDAARQWIIEDGSWFVFDPQKDWQSPVNRITQQPAPISEPPEDLFALDQSPDTKSVAALYADIRRATERGMPVQPYWTDLHAKFSQPALIFVMIWLAIPFAMRLRRGGLAIGFGVSVAIALVYLLVFRMSMGLGHYDRIPPLAAAWLASVAFLIAGVILFRRTPT